ncbi:hypothetical protein WA026_005137 [Henosepilachna vigintioctopunctata]|uniref:Uncharacterized protein n=1 Tax=Henosepilachna vigintioctopunctata TaxID=420089 RepID=A0AAW1UN21_9CUCU
MDRKSEILTKYGSRLLIDRSKGHLEKSESRNIETSAMKRKSELLTKYGSRMLANSKANLPELQNLPELGTKLKVVFILIGWSYKISPLKMKERNSLKMENMIIPKVYMVLK